MRAHVGPAFFIIKDKDAYKSFVGWLRDVERVGAELWPEMDSFDLVQAEADRRMARYGSEQLPRRKPRSDRGRRQPARDQGVGL